MRTGAVFLVLNLFLLVNVNAHCTSDNKSGYTFEFFNASNQKADIPDDLKKTKLKYDFDPGDSVAKIKIITHGQASLNSIKVLAQWKGVLVIDGEGPSKQVPHFKAGFTEWKSIEVKNASFDFPKAGEIKFPAFSPEDLKKAIAPMGKKWKNLADGCQGILKYPCVVRPAEVTLQLQSHEGKFIKQITLSFPVSD
jgi:hypothetical protein